MSETKRERRSARAERGGPVGGSPSQHYAVVASGENVVLVNTTTGQTWAMGHDGGRPIWQPVAFEGGAHRAPKRTDPKKGEEG